MATLHFMYGLPGAGKTTLARELASRERALLFVEDEWLRALAAPITSLADLRAGMERVRSLIGPLAEQALRLGVNVVFDFGANTALHRAWVRRLFEAAGADHVLHLLDVPVDECRRRVHARNASQPAGLYFGDVSDAIFDAVLPHIAPPSPEESFLVRTMSGLVPQLATDKVEVQLQNEERFREVFDLAPAGYATLEENDTITEINHCGAELLGQQRADLVGQRFTAFVAPSSLTVFASLVTGAQTQGGAVQGELDLGRRGAPLPVRLHATMLGRKKPTVLLAFEDISERRAKELELARVEHALRDAMRRKDEFLSALSHELRNPLAPIRMSVSVLEMIGLTNDKAREAVEIIGRSSAHLTRLIDDLLDVTRIARSKINLKREAVELSALVRHVVDEHAAQFAASGIRVDVNLSLAPLWVNGDPARLVQIVSNLLGNAEKFTPSGGRVSVITEVTNRAVLLRVRDTGVGIAPDVIAELGVPFVQATQSIDRSRGGLGLGLAMVRSLAELHGGSIAIRSEGVGRGTEVLVSLPEYTAPVVPAPEPILASVAPPRRVLLIEDNPDAARSLAKALGLRGHDVAVAHDGRRGIARAGEMIPDLVLCDLGLPDCDGYLVARRLREDPRLRDVSLVALSGYAQPDDIARSTAAGFDRHLAKPASLVDIDAILRDLPRR